MLAVNGSVEAARAGEFGKGFAVYRRISAALRAISGDNAVRIKDTVVAIQSQISAMRRERGTYYQRGDRKPEDGRRAGKLRRRAKGRGADRCWQRPDRRYAEAILASMKDVAQSARQVASVAEELASAAAQAAAAAKQQARGAEDLAAAIEEIASLAETVQQRNG